MRRADRLHLLAGLVSLLALGLSAWAGSAEDADRRKLSDTGDLPPAPAGPCAPCMAARLARAEREAAARAAAAQEGQEGPGTAAPVGESAE